MDFFAQQDHARRQTRMLLGLFVLLLGIVTGLWAWLWLAVGPLLLQGQAGSWEDPLRQDQSLLWVVIALPPVLITVVTLWRMGQLRHGGGAAVARLMGGRRVARNTDDLQEQQLLNVADEMALAAGIPVPDVYVLDQEKGINAFAAGYSLDQAVVAVTRGALDQLTRNELQGVVAHEFGHIVNSDIRTNIRLTGVVAGFMAMTTMGYFLLRAFGDSRRGRPTSRSDSRTGGSDAVWLAFLAIFLLILGYVATLAGRIIQSAISRQREYAADAHGVQYTRDPDGLGGALLKLAGGALGMHSRASRYSRIKNPYASEMNHMLFGDGLGRWQLALFASHPPLKSRIQRIAPHLLAQGLLTEAMPAAPGAVGAVGPAGGTGRPLSQATAPASAMSSNQTIPQVGVIQADHAALARALHSAIPDDVKGALKSEQGMIALTVALVLCKQPSPPAEDHDGQMLEAHGLGPQAPLVQGLRQQLLQQEALPLATLELLAPQLRHLPRESGRNLLQVIEALIQRDHQVSAWECVVQAIVTSAIEGEGTRRILYHAPVRDLLSDVLAVLAGQGPGDDQAAMGRYLQGMRKSGFADVTQEKAAAAIQHADPIQLGAALKVLRHSTPGTLRRIVHACCATIWADGRVELKEYELLRAITASLGCPMPPLLPEERRTI